MNSRAARKLNISLLQVAILLGGCVPVGAGLAGVIMGPGMVMGADNSSIPMDSHFRYLSGLLLAIGLSFWSTIPNIERQAATVRLLTLIVVIGGLARLVSVYVLGWPNPPMLFGLAMELIVTPLLCYWQHRVVKT